MVASAARGLAALATVAAVAGCTVTELPAPAYQVGVTTQIRSLDPAIGNDAGTATIARFAFETLPQIAHSTRADAAEHTWTFQIAGAHRFADGRSVDAAAVVANFTRWSRGGATVDAFTAYARTFGSPRDAAHTIRHVSAPDATHVTIETQGRFDGLPAALADPHFSIAAPATFGAAAGDQMPAGSGPYRIANVVSGDYVLLVPQTSTRDRFAAVYVRYIPDPRTTLLSLGLRDVDVVYGLAPDLVGEAKGQELHPVREPATGLWCAFAAGTPSSRRVCPPAAASLFPVRAESTQP